MNLYIGDIHFGHKSVIQFDNRPFADVEAMDRVLIERWNKHVQAKDNVYIIGDFAYRNQMPEEWYLDRLKGKKHLIIGNHDNRLLKNEKAMAYFESVEKMKHVSDTGKQICLCHFPLAEWNNMYRGAYHIYGHIHIDRGATWQFMKTRERALNAGCMINNYMPVSFQELIINNEAFKQEHEVQ